MKTVIFEGKYKFEVDKKIRDWKSTNPNAVFIMPPVEICMSTLEKGKPAGAKKDLASDLISVCFEYKD